jgi:predicted Zn-dependent protease
MNRRGMLGLAAGLLLLTGCTHDGTWTIEKILGWDEESGWKQGKVSAATPRIAEKVDDLGRKIIARNSFTGLDPFFNTIGVPENVLFHSGADKLYVSEGLVNACHNEAEMAAVLCSELGKMIAEQRQARALGREKDPHPVIQVAANGLPAGEVASQPSLIPAVGPDNRDAATTHDPVALAKDLLNGAGFDPVELDRVASLLKPTPRGEALRKQMAGTAPAPIWVNTK